MSLWIVLHPQPRGARIRHDEIHPGAEHLPGPGQRRGLGSSRHSSHHADRSAFHPHGVRLVPTRWIAPVDGPTHPGRCGRAAGRRADRRVGRRVRPRSRPARRLRRPHLRSPAGAGPAAAGPAAASDRGGLLPPEPTNGLPRGDRRRPGHDARPGRGRPGPAGLLADRSRGRCRRGAGLGTARPPAAAAGRRRSAPTPGRPSGAPGHRAGPGRRTEPVGVAVADVRRDRARVARSAGEPSGLRRNGQAARHPGRARRRRLALRE